MPSVNVPGVGKVNFPDTMSQADIIAAIERDILPNVKKETIPPPAEAGFSLADTATALKQGVIGSAKAITDVFGAENVVSAKLGAIQKELGEEYTPARKAEMARREALQQQAAKTGTARDEIGTFLAGVAEAPVQSLAQGLGSIVPYVGTGIVGAIAKLAAPTVRAINTVVGAAQGAGAVKGSLYDNVKNELVKSGYSEEQADKEARQAQEYLGANFVDILGGTALGGVAARFGVENLLTPGAAARLNANLLPRMGKAALAEAPLEGAQAGQEQLAVNRALQKEGFSVGTFEGVLGAAARDAAVGAMVGSAVGIRGPGAPMAKPDTEKTIADETKTKEVKDQEAALQGQPPPPPSSSDAELSLLMDPVIDEKGNLLQEGGVDVTQQTDVTAGGVGTEVPGGPESDRTAEGAPGAGRPGVVSDQGVSGAVEDGKGVQQPTLDFTSDRYKKIPFVDPDTKQPTNLNFSEAYVEDGEIYIPSDGEFDYPLGEMNFKNEEGQALKQALLTKFAKELEAQVTEPPTETPTETPTEPVAEEVIDEQALADQEAKAAAAAAVQETQQPKLDFATWTQQKGISLTDPNQNWAALEAQYNAEVGAAPAAVAAPTVKPTTTTKAKPAKKAAPQIVEGYLNKPSYYSAEKPKNVDEALNYAGHEQAFDLFDTVDIKDGVNPELQRLADERNKEQEAKRKQMREELTGKIDPETGKKYTPKRITSLVSNIPLYKAGAPLEFLSEDELVSIYRQHAGKRAFLKEEATSREENKATREEFVETLDPLQKTKINFVADRSFADEVIATARRKAQTTAADKRKSREKKEKEKLFFDVQQQIAEAKEDVAQREKVAQKAAEQEALEEDALRATAQEISTAADKVLPKKAKAAPVEPVKSKLDVALTKAINEGTVKGVLEVTGDRKLNDRMTGVIAGQFIKILENFSIDATIDFGRLKAGEDGKFDPKTNKITIRGNAKDGYTGTRPLAETVMHEISHATLDHVFDNEAKFIQSLPPERRKDAQAALNRLKQNHRVIKERFGKKYNIDSLKEFAAEYWSNPQLQEDLALMPSPTPYSPKENIFVTIAKNIAAALGIGNPREGAAFKEIAEDLAQLISLPTADIRGKEVSYSKQAEPLRASEEIFPENYENSEYGLGADYQPKDLKYVKKLFFTKEGWRRIATALQNERYAIKHWEEQNDLAGKIKYEGKDEINNIYGQLTLSVSRAKNLFHEFVQETYEELNKSVYELSKELNLDMKDTLDSLHRIMEALHDPERRLAKYVMTVPLSIDANIPTKRVDPNGKMIKISAANRRTEIMNLLNTRTMTKEEARKLRGELNALIFTTDANGQRVPNMKYVDPNGSSPSGKKEIELTNEEYNATGLSPAAAAARIDKYNKLNPKVKSLVDNVLKKTEEMHRITTDLNKSANYWSQPVSNRVAFYGFEHYVPLKGIDKHSEADELLDFDSERLGKELQETAYSFDGRMSVSDNPVLQSMSDAVRAAMRAGRVDLTQAIKNAVEPNKLNPKGQGLLKGEVIKHLTFEERQDENVLKALPRDYTIFHYNPDGSIDVIAIRDKPQREAIRRTYRDTNSLVNFANNITSALGMMHTRYNYNFAPLNFVRDALTNAWALGAEMGPAEAARFIAQISNKVVTGGSLRKGMEIAKLYETKNYAKIRELAKKNPIYKEMVEFIEEGGMVEYLQGISLKSNAQQLYKEVGRSGIITKWDQFNRLVDMWTDMFELSSRSAAYAIAKKNFMDKGLEEGPARTKAAAYAKNLANFEQVGKYGREMGAAFMFFRPSATGAVRAIEAVAPAFFNVDKVVMALPNEGAFAYTQEKNQPRVYKDPKAIAEFKANYAFKQKSARYMTLALGGAGAFAYMMALMMADEDDLGRNKVMNDDMSQWTRFGRFYIPGFENPLQVPWGFGLGAFLSSGAQLAAVLTGQQSIGGALGNIATQISLDSFIPIPVSRMPASDNPPAWIVDSLTPSMLRPVVEFVMNKNGLGQDIYNDSNRRMGDAYLGSDHIPETYKLISANLFKETGGSIDISPNTLYFLANSYIDGPSRVVDAIVNGTYLIAGTKEFKAKTDVPLIGSFIGSVPNVDSREFRKLEEKIEDKQKRFGNAELDPVLYAKMLADDPLAPVVIAIYNDTVGSQLKDLRQEANRIRRDQNLTPKDKTELLKVNAISQNIIRYNMKQTFDAYGIKP